MDREQDVEQVEPIDDGASRWRLLLVGMGICTVVGGLIEMADGSIFAQDDGWLLLLTSSATGAALLVLLMMRLDWAQGWFWTPVPAGFVWLAIARLFYLLNREPAWSFEVFLFVLLNLIFIVATVIAWRFAQPDV